MKPLTRLGGEGKTGKVLEVRGWDRESGYSVACVQWTFTGTSNVYRVGHKGKVDLKYIQEGQGGFYYRDHLGVLGKLLFFKFSTQNIPVKSDFFLRYERRYDLQAPYSG